MIARIRRDMSIDFPPLPNRVVVTNDLSAARKIQKRILAQAGDLGYSDKNRFAIRLAVEEALVNAYRHGNHRDPAKKITICYDVQPHQITVRIADEGKGFDPDGLPDPTCDERLGDPEGRGVMLMRSFADEVVFNEAGNEVQLVKRQS